MDRLWNKNSFSGFWWRSIRLIYLNDISILIFYQIFLQVCSCVLNYNFIQVCNQISLCVKQLLGTRADHYGSLKQIMCWKYVYFKTTNLLVFFNAEVCWHTSTLQNITYMYKILYSYKFSESDDVCYSHYWLFIEKGLHH